MTQVTLQDLHIREAATDAMFSYLRAVNLEYPLVDDTTALETLKQQIATYPTNIPSRPFRGFKE